VCPSVRASAARTHEPSVRLPDGSPNPSGDSLNWQFNFGDNSAPPFNPDGTFNPDFDHFCRVQHTYGEGTFIATLSVTDKHPCADGDHDGNARVAYGVTAF